MMRMKHEDFIEPIEKFRRKPLSRRIYGDRGQVFLRVADNVHKTNRSLSRMLHFGRAQIAPRFVGGVFRRQAT